MLIDHSNMSRAPREVFDTESAGSLHLRYRQEPDPAWENAMIIFGILVPCSGYLCYKKEAMSATYVEVYENRLEWNKPCVCCCNVFDRINTLHFDRDMVQNASKTEACLPCFTHCRLMPTCCDVCGEGLTIYGDTGLCNQRGACVGQTCYCLICFMRQSVTLYGLKDAKELKRALNDSRTHRVSRGVVRKAPPSVSPPVVSQKQQAPYEQKEAPQSFQYPTAGVSYSSYSSNPPQSANAPPPYPPYNKL